MSKAGFTGLLLAIVMAWGGIQAQTQPSSAHPAGVAHRAFVVAVLERNLPEARSHMSGALIAALPEQGGLAKVCADRVGLGRILGIQTLSTEVSDNKAVVSYRLQLADGSSRFGKDALVFEDGAWKLDVEVGR
jgi:hypothetical protein